MFHGNTVRFPAVISTIVQYTIIGSRVFALAVATLAVPQIPIILQKARVLQGYKLSAVIFHAPRLIWLGMPVAHFCATTFMIFRRIYSIGYFGLSYSAETLCATLLTREPADNWCFLMSYYESRKVNRYTNSILQSMELTTIVHVRPASSRDHWELAENTKMVARHCRTNTTHNLCTLRRDTTIMKESRCELINSAKPEKRDAGVD